MTIAELVTNYEQRAQEIREEMPDYEPRGCGPYYRHKLAMIEEFIRALKKVDEVKP